jgi:hypothetical protein
MQIRDTNIHRRSNGTVDMDVYRREAFLLRRETTNQSLRRLGRLVRPHVGAIAIVISSALLLPAAEGAVAKLAQSKVSSLSDSLRTLKLNHRSQ